MESNLEQQTPKLPKINVTNVSSAVFGKEGPALGKESKIGKLARIVRTTRIKVNTIEKILPEHQEVIGSNAKKIKINTEKIISNVKKTTENTEKIISNVKKTTKNAKKITSIKNTLQNQKSKIGEKLPGSNKDNKNNFNKTLVETNKILVEIQKQLASDFAMQVAEQKGDEQKEKKERSREKLKAEESALEKGRKRIGAALANTTKKVLSPFKGIFDQIKEFVLTVGAGIAVNAAFKWLSDEENRKKMEDAFSFIKNNWKWIAGVAAGLFLMGPIIGIVSSIISVGSILFTIGSFLFGLLGAPALLTLLGIITSAGGIAMLADALGKSISGGGQFAAFDEAARQKYLRSNKTTQSGVVMGDDGKSVKFEDIFGNKTLMGSVTTERDAIAKGEDPDEYARKMGMALPSQVKAYLGEEKYNATIEAVDAFQKAMQDKDAIKNRYFKELDKVAPKGLWDPTGYFRMVNADDNKKAKVKALDEKYNVELAPLFERLAGTRRMGGPVTSGKPYLVGESGPELFMPRIDGSIIDNTRTEKIYQVLSSGKRGKIRTITLPPEIIEGAKAQTQMPLSIGEATKEPTISSTNPMDGSRVATSGIYGIMV